MHREICVKDYSGTAAPRILKFGADLVWLLVLCKKESAFSCLSFPLFVHFSFSQIKFFVMKYEGCI